MVLFWLKKIIEKKINYDPLSFLFCFAFKLCFPVSSFSIWFYFVFILNITHSLDLFFIISWFFISFIYFPDLVLFFNCLFFFIIFLIRFFFNFFPRILFHFLSKFGYHYFKCSFSILFLFYVIFQLSPLLFFSLVFILDLIVIILILICFFMIKNCVQDLFLWSSIWSSQSHDQSWWFKKLTRFNLDLFLIFLFHYLTLNH